MWQASCGRWDFSSRKTASILTSPDGPAWLWQGCNKGLDESVAGQKRAWKFSMFRVGSTQQMKILASGIAEARPVATATASDIS
jgi:hypothetical protein